MASAGVVWVKPSEAPCASASFNNFRQNLIETWDFIKLAWLLIWGYKFKVVRSRIWNSCGRQGGAGDTLQGGAPSRWRARWMKLSGMIGAGSAQIPKDGIAAACLMRARSVFATATVPRVWLWRSAILGAATSPISQWIYQGATRHSCPPPSNRGLDRQIDQAQPCECVVY